MTKSLALSDQQAVVTVLLARASAYGKVILCGEHAVVYGHPAIAVPLRAVQATAEVFAAAAGQGVVIEAVDLARRFRLDDAADDEPLATAARQALAYVGIVAAPDWRIAIRSAVPIAGGLGSGAAVSAALIRAVARAARREMPPADLSSLVFAVEQLYHGTPSGIDNTVIAYEQPIYFIKGQPPQPLDVAVPFTLLIADTGVASLTKQVVGDVRRAWQQETARYEVLFERIGQVVVSVRQALAQGDLPSLGHLLNENQTLLHALGVSSPELERLRAAALSAGALGAKLSGAGRGGHLIALVTPETAPAVDEALRAAGARQVIPSLVT